tara:strand:+ start:1242 stop:1526 length:285 start_codon:yes stop_codon:yes gene_type:complete
MQIKDLPRIHVNEMNFDEMNTKEKFLKALAVRTWRSFTDHEKDLVGGLCIFPAVKMQCLPWMDAHDHHFLTCELLKLSRSHKDHKYEQEQGLCL